MVNRRLVASGLRARRRNDFAACKLSRPMAMTTITARISAVLQPGSGGLLALGAVVLLVQVAAFLFGDSSDLIVGDAKGHYAWARSVVIDGDIDFRNDYEALFGPETLPPEYFRPTPVRDTYNKYAVGLPLIELPAVAAAHLGAWVTPSVAADGVSWPYHVLVVSELVLLALIGLLVLHRAMVAEGVSRDVASLLVFGMVIATNLLHYLAKEPAMAHAAGVAVLCLIIAINAKGQRARPLSSARSLGVGLLFGLLLLIRNSNLAFLPFVAVLLVRRSGWSWRLTWAAAGPLLAAGVHFWTTYQMWGGFRVSTYGEEGFTAGLHGVIATLTSARHGLFLYHPAYLLLLGCVVVALARSGLRPLASAALASFLVLTLINGTWWCWWFGDSFGNRAFIETLPVLVFVVGVSMPARARAKQIAAVVAVLTALNLWLWSGYLFGLYPADGRHLVAEAWLWPLF